MEKAYSPYDHTTDAQAVTPMAEIPLVSILKFPRIMWYPNNETEVNSNVSNKDRIVSEKNVFWDK